MNFRKIRKSRLSKVFTMNFAVLFAVVSATVLTLAGFAREAFAGSISLMGGGDWSRVEVHSAPPTGGSSGTGAQIGYGGGALLNFDFAGGPFSFETGGLYMHHKEAYGGGTLEMNQLDVPADFRVWIGRVFSIGAGGYYAFGLGDIQETSPNGSTTLNVPYGGIRTTDDYGALGSVRFQFPLGDSTNFLINGNYLYGMKNVNDNGDGTNLRTREIQTMVGLSFYW